MATTAEIITQIDTIVYEIVTGGASSKSWNGRSYTILDLKQLQDLRTYYTKIESQTASTSANIPIVSNADFSGITNY